MRSTQAPAALSLCGITVRAEKVRLLAGILGEGQLATKLERAIANNNTIIALDVEERQHIVEALDQNQSVSDLAELRRGIREQLARLNRKHEQERRKETNMRLMRGAP
jgi:hypothetical protein